ncbi:putative H/ACA ribonucleoprotein complex, subunit Gar1/Naf1 [Helianthus annuus]|nr:putative H/ACA ribonucleoprotein complex, subunit Gar1/Naf1 [Helianthus annuus]
MRTKTLIYTFKHSLIANYAEVSYFVHACEGDAAMKFTNEKIPYFNALIYLQNKTQIGQVDEIFGPINESVNIFCGFFPVKMLEGIIATSYILIRPSFCLWRAFFRSPTTGGRGGGRGSGRAGGHGGGSFRGRGTLRGGRGGGFCGGGRGGGFGRGRGRS